MLSFVGCKPSGNVAPATVETPEVKTLKTYYANVANVDVSKVIYDQKSDTFSIQNEFKISHVKLLKHYNDTLTGRIQP